MPDNVQFTFKEKQVLRAYRDPSASGMGQAIRMSLMYAVVATLFLWLAISNHEPMYALGIYALLIIFMGKRIIIARRIAGVMPQILRRYEEQMAELQQQLQKNRTPDRAV